jgi:2-dehydro-3-deoxyphosphogluconate aldolase/(4S)-4-hydroxy-2-oxoglutarate aldolase
MVLSKRNEEDAMKLDVPIIGIVRGVEAAFFHELMDNAFTSGLQAIEITMNTENALQIVSSLRPAVPAGKLLGMGTVRNREEAKKAVGAGAMFLVTPNTDTDVIEYAGSCNVPVISGALTPTEVYTAWSAGADMVKVFPCRPFGPGYVRELRGPFENVPLVAVGGVTADNVNEYFDAGVRAVGVSTSLFGQTALKDRNLEEIALNIRKFIALCPDGRK